MITQCSARLSRIILQKRRSGLHSLWPHHWYSDQQKYLFRWRHFTSRTAWMSIMEMAISSKICPVWNVWTNCSVQGGMSSLALLDKYLILILFSAGSAYPTASIARWTLNNSSENVQIFLLFNFQLHWWQQSFTEENVWRESDRQEYQYFHLKLNQLHLLMNNRIFKNTIALTLCVMCHLVFLKLYL